MAMLSQTAARPGVIASTRLTGTGATSVLSANQNPDRTVEISTITIANDHSGAVTVKVALLPNGAADDAARLVLPATSIASKDVLSLKELLGGAFLSPGDFVSVTASVANVITVTITGKVTA